MTTATTYAILIHGWGGSPKTWDSVRWPASWTTFAYTLPGHAERAEEGPWTIPAAAEDLADYIREVLPAGAKALLIAHSMGGQLSMLVHARHPELVAGEVVIDPAYNGDDSPAGLADTEHTLAEFRKDAHGTMSEFIKGAFSKYLPEEARRVIADDAARTNAQALTDYFSSEYLEEGSFGLARDTPSVAKLRTKPVLGFYTSPVRSGLERDVNPDGLDVDISLWESDHGHFMHMEDPGRFARETVAWAERKGLAAGDDAPAVASASGASSAAAAPATVAAA